MNPEARRKARFWLALVFVLGAAIGGVFGYSFAHRSYAATTPSPTLSEPERRAKRIAEITHEIGLTPEQSQKFDAILRETHEQMKAVHDKADEDTSAMRQKARNQMRVLLSPDQLPKFETMVQRLDEERKKQQQPAK